MHNCQPQINSIGHEIKALNHIMQRKMLMVADDEGIDKITLMHGWIIAYLFDRKDDDVYQKDIETSFAISRSTVTNIVKLMEKKDYIKRQNVESDARLKKILLTQKGIEIHQKIHQVIMENENRFNSVLSDSEREQFFYLIKKLRNGIEKNITANCKKE